VLILRRAVAALTLALLVASSARLFAPAGPAHACTDHVCACRRAPAPELPKAGACHESEEPGGAVSLQSTCNHHDQAAGGAGTLLPAALLPPAPAGVTVASETIASPPAPQPRAMAPVPAAPPPRSASC
jgi:hypothetical protein